MKYSGGKNRNKMWTVATAEIRNGYTITVKA